MPKGIISLAVGALNSLSCCSPVSLKTLAADTIWKISEGCGKVPKWLGSDEGVGDNIIGTQN